MKEQDNLSQRERNPSLPETPWERWGRRFADLMPYATLATALVLVWLQPELSWRARGEATLLAGLAAGWVYLLFTRCREDRWSHPARMLVYFAGFLALAGVLMTVNAIFFLFAVTGFIHAAALRPPLLVFLGVGLTSTLINTVITGFPWPEQDTWIFYGALILFQTVASGSGILFVEKVAGLSEERKQAVERLEAAMKENAGLQAQLVTQAREAGILEERQRLAREIHDTIAQGLIGVITQLGAAQQSLDRPERMQRHLEHALMLARDSLNEARRSVHALGPGPLEHARLPEALAEAAHTWSNVHGVRAEVMVTGEPAALPPEVEAALLRIAQEALANVSKHARATRAGLTLSYMEDEVALDIRDDGAGFQIEEDSAGGFGLDSMRQRMEQLDGTLEIESEPGNGTAVSARVPVRSPEAAR